VPAPDTSAADSQRQTVCEVAEQLQDRTKILDKAVVVQEEASSIAKRVFTSLSRSSVDGGFMFTPPLAYLVGRAYAAATQVCRVTRDARASTARTHTHLSHVAQEQRGESFTAAAGGGGGQLRARTGGQGVAKRRGSVRDACVYFWSVNSVTCDTVYRWLRARTHRW